MDHGAASSARINDLERNSLRNKTGNFSVANREFNLSSSEFTRGECRRSETSTVIAIAPATARALLVLRCRSRTQPPCVQSCWRRIAVSLLPRAAPEVRRRRAAATLYCLWLGMQDFSVDKVTIATIYDAVAAAAARRGTRTLERRSARSPHPGQDAGGFQELRGPIRREEQMSSELSERCALPVANFVRTIAAGIRDRAFLSRITPVRRDRVTAISGSAESQPLATW
jgi:hypothetical protein